MFSLLKYGARSLRCVAGLKFGYRYLSAEPNKDAHEHVMAIVMDTLKKIDKCNISKLTPNATFEELGINM